MKSLRYRLEALGVWVLFLFFRVLPLDLASCLGGGLGRFVGRFAVSSRKAEARLRFVLPGRSDTEYQDIIRRMWDNLGRIFAEYPHLERIGRERVTIHGTAHVPQGKASIVFGIHAANWELAAPVMMQQMDQELHITYRAPNNPWVDRLLWKARTLNGRVTAFPKARDSGRKIMASLKGGTPVGILIDQKYNEGIAAPFMGHGAMTNPVFAQLAQRFDCPIIPARNVRRPGKRVEFDLTFYPQLVHKDEDSNALPLESVIERAHLMIEQWITDDPAAWLWLHDRWGSKRLIDTQRNTGNIEDKI